MSSLYLASQSPRRRELLTQIGVGFTVINVDVVEKREAYEQPLDYVQRLSHAKAMAGAAEFSDKPVLGADTIVVLEQGSDLLVLEKPKDMQHGVEMLMHLSGRRHQVITAVTVHHKNKSKTRVNTSTVEFRSIDEREAARYWSTGEPKDKAGGYGIQGLGSVFVRQISGSYSSIVGLPLFETTELLRAFNVDYWQ